ncbi:MAG: hypothetical protein K2G25_05510 [Oscillospiraceae bacterium]|nr:hypothetical protein [Oscillospiraceae bacterium]
MSEESKNTADLAEFITKGDVEKIKQIDKMLEDIRNLMTGQYSNQTQQTLDLFQAVMQSFFEIYSTSTSMQESLNTLDKLREELHECEAYIESLTPYIEVELLQFKELHPEINLTLQDVLDCMDITGNVINAQAQKEIAMLVETAKEKHEADADKEKISVSAKKPEAIPFPLDKVSQNLFKFLEAGTYSMNVEKSGSNDSLNTIITLDFEELEKNKALTFKQLTPFEKRVYIASGALQKAGNNYISATQIYKQMGGKGRPATYQIEKIIEACENMSRIRLTIDNDEEAEKYNYPRFKKGSFYLFPAESVENVKINGREVEYCLHFLKDELPLFALARQRKQITAYTPEQYALPFSMTDDNILLDDYFRTRIARIKRDKEKKKPYNNKMLYTTIYENCGINTKKKRYDATKKFRKLLDHYQKTGIITGYQEQQDGIIIIL